MIVNHAPGPRLALCFSCNWRAHGDGLREALDLQVSHVEGGGAADALASSLRRA